jgi:hypothetical protein
MRRTLAAAALAATAGLATAAAATAAPAAAAPKVGDWEATGGHGSLASFQVTSGGRSLDDLVVQAPISCTNAFGTPLPVDVEVLAGTARVSRSGSFDTGSIGKRAGGTAVSGRVRRGAIDLTYRHVTRAANAYEGGEEVCDTRTLHLTARPGHRHAVRDGIWEGRTAESEPVELNVVAGGRALTSPSTLGPGGTQFYSFEVADSSGNDACGYTLSSPLLLAANGSFTNAPIQLGDDAVVTGAFSKRSWSGEFSNGPEGCAPQSWSATWAFARP